MNKKTSSSNNAAKMNSPSGQRTWHGMGKRAVLVALLGLGLVAQEAKGETVLFSDTFDVTANSLDVNFQNTNGRQSGGSLSVINYTEAGGDGSYNQVGHSFSPGALLLVGSDSSLGYVSPDHNFIENPGTGSVSFVRFTVDPVLPLSPNQSASSWMGLALGTSIDKRNIIVNATDGFAIAFQGSGNFIAFDGANVIGDGTYTTATNGFNPVEIRITGSVDGNPWDGTNGTLISVFADGKDIPFFRYMKPGVGYTNNWITVMGGYEGGTSVSCHGVDDFQVGTTTIASTNRSLKVDFQHTTSATAPETQAGFRDFNETDAGSATYPTAAGDITVALSGLDAQLGGFYNRGGVVNSGSLTFAGIYKDYAFKNGASPQSLTLALSGPGILPRERYRLTFYSYDDYETSSHSVSFSGASGTTGSAGPLIYTCETDPTSNAAYSVTGYFKADASGTLTVLATDTFSGGTSGIRLNAFEIAADFLPKGTMIRVL